MQTIVSLLERRPTLIRGNASEIMAVAGAAGATTRGVDSTAATSDALASGKQLAQEYGCIVGISGADDLVSAYVDAERMLCKKWRFLLLFLYLAYSCISV